MNRLERWVPDSGFLVPGFGFPVCGSRFWVWSVVLAVLLVSPCAVALPAAPPIQDEATARQLREEEARDYYQKWLNEDVVYIVTDEEREVFEQLTSDEEKEIFIEQFWHRRDTDLRTARNEFKEEHYRRIAYANEHFTSGKAGWKTDRGRVYIIHGPPTEIQESFGGPYHRPMYEGGGETTTYPYQVWRYRKIDGVGEDVELEFVDKTLTGDYRLARDHWEKDAAANVPNVGLTEAEQRGLAAKKDRFIADGGLAYYPMLALRGKDRPFQRLERYAGVMRPLEVKFQDLKRLVDVEISYSSLPFRLHQDHFRLNDTHVIVPVTIEVANKDLTFVPEGGVHRARIAIYGMVKSLGQRVLKEFESEVASTLPRGAPEPSLAGTSLYQKLIVLEQGRRVKLDLVIKDVNSGKVGAVSRALVTPTYSEGELRASSLILSDTIEKLEDPPEDGMFVLGDMHVRPSLDRVFPADKLMGVYLQLYNVGIDQATLEPSLNVTYRLFRGSDLLMEINEEDGESIEFFSASRVVLTRTFSPAMLGPGEYTILVQASDLISNQMATVSNTFEVKAEKRTRVSVVPGQ